MYVVIIINTNNTATATKMTQKAADERRAFLHKTVVRG